MKTYLSVLFAFFCISINSQNCINKKLIELEVLNLNSNKRVSNGESERTICDVAKKAADLHLDYLVKNGLFSHQSNIVLKGKNLVEPYERFDFFNKDSIKPINSSGNISLHEYDGEVISYRTKRYLNDSTINSKIATDIFNGFCNSKPHNHILNSRNFFEGLKTTGYFSVNVKVMQENLEFIHLEIYCVGVMSNTYIK